MHLPACGGNPEILRKLDLPRISRFREAGDSLGGKNEVHPTTLANTTLNNLKTTTNFEEHEYHEQ